MAKKPEKIIPQTNFYFIIPLRVTFIIISIVEVTLRIFMRKIAKTKLLKTLDKSFGLCYYM